MVKQYITRWSPDTCGCVIEYSWDADLPDESRVHTYSSTIKDCPEHSGLGSAIYNVILDENQRKNKVHGELLKINAISEDKIQDNGSTIRQLKAGIVYNWNFDIDRNLEVQILGATLSVAEKAALQAICDSTFGVNKVKVL